jgi:hypothetical protein
MASEEAQIAADCKLWKKHAPLLYDVAITHSLAWPSLTCQWLPVATPVQDGDYVEHKLLLGTHVGEDASRDDRNHLMIATVRLPAHDAELKVNGFDEEKGELGGYGGSLAKVEVDVKINHPTEVNRARYCPGNPFLLATKTASSDVLVFDYSKHPSKPRDDVVRAELVLTGHNHGYERFLIGDIHYVVDAGGGALLTNINDTRAEVLAVYPDEESKRLVASSSYGVSAITIAGDGSIRVERVNERGEPTDSYTVSAP